MNDAPWGLIDGPIIAGIFLVGLILGALIFALLAWLVI
jgi:hypothetical protein